MTAALPLLVDRDEAARALRCSPAVIDRLAAAGALTPVLLDDEDASPKFLPDQLVDLVDKASGLAGADALEAHAGELDGRRRASAPDHAEAIANERAAASSPTHGDAIAAGQRRVLLSATDDYLRLSGAKSRAAALVLRVDPLLESVLKLCVAIREERELLLPTGPAAPAIEAGPLPTVLDRIDGLADVLRGQWPAAVEIARREAALRIDATP